MPDDLLYTNGIDAVTGGPLLPALAAATVAKIASGIVERIGLPNARPARPEVGARQPR
jgi:hypothetical protein